MHKTEQKLHFRKSIKTNGLLTNQPLLVYHVLGGDDEGYWVIDGNHRLAALFELQSEKWPDAPTHVTAIVVEADKYNDYDPRVLHLLTAATNSAQRQVTRT